MDTGGMINGALDYYFEGRWIKYAAIFFIGLLIGAYG